MFWFDPFCIFEDEIFVNNYASKIILQSELNDLDFL